MVAFDGAYICYAIRVASYKSVLELFESPWYEHKSCFIGIMTIVRKKSF